MWLSYRYFTARGRERVPLFGEVGLVRAMWPACPASIDAGGTGLLVDYASAILRLGESDLRN